MIPFNPKLIALLAVALAFAAITAWGLYWRGEAREARIAVTALKAQGDVLAKGLEACNRSVAAAEKAGQAAVAQGAQLLAEARRLSAGGKRQADRIEDLLKQPTPAGADCREAWQKIDQDRKAGAAK